MQQQKLGSRVRVAELKDMIVNRLGAERSKMYFYYLNRFLNQKLSKSEFVKLCQRVVGRENHPLHNQLIQSILKNVCASKTHPISQECPAKTETEAGLGKGRLLFGGSGTSAVTWANGVASPRKVRVDNCDGTYRNHHNLAENNKDKSMPVPLGGQCLSRAADELVSLDREDRRVEQYGRLSYCPSPAHSPLGIPFCSASISGSHKAFSLTTADTHLSCCSSEELSDTETLRTRMEKLAVGQNLGGVSIECAHLLNRMLDVYLKRLITSCVDLVEAKSDNETKRLSVHQKQLVQGNYLNGMLPDNQHYMATITSSGIGPMSSERTHPAILLLDFKVAMELNPQQLGEDWPSIFDKICMYSFED